MNMNLEVHNFVLRSIDRYPLVCVCTRASRSRACGLINLLQWSAYPYVAGIARAVGNNRRYE